MSSRWYVLLIGLCISAGQLLCPTSSVAQEKLLPPTGIELDDAVAAKLRSRVEELSVDIDQLAQSSTDAKSWKPDVEVFVRAVRLALEQQLFYTPKDADVASELLDEASRRLEEVVNGKRGLELLRQPTGQGGDPRLVVGGFVSRIDDSVQPYGLVVPISYRGENIPPHRMDVWLHGRGDDKVELSFLKERMTKLGEYTPDETIVLHPFGRHCNAFKFAGETDVYEAISHVKSFLNIDSNKISIRGFSMGGAGCWHLGVHNPGQWFAVNPGAGFVDTIVYQGWKENPPYAMSDAQKRLLMWYDVLPWVANLRNTNVLAYSGELDKQKQAADQVQAEADRLSVPMQHVIGAGMGHKIDKPSATKIDAVLADWAKERPKPPKSTIDFMTYTLRYPQSDWVRITGMKKHWEPSRVQATIEDERIQIKTEAVTSLELDFGDSWETYAVTMRIDGNSLTPRDDSEKAGFQCCLVHDGERWTVVNRLEAAKGDDAGVQKRPGLQGPIDDAFCDRFLFVIPSRPAAHGAAQRWIDRELRYAQERWKQLMRGEVRVVQDTTLTEEQIATSNLICFGDFTSNRYLAGIAHALPIRWDRENLQVGSKSFDPSKHVAVFCYPNPANPNRYVVVNSGMTFRDFSNTSNSRQIAMLPDWAIMDVQSKDNHIIAGEVVDEGFFDEQWQLDEPAGGAAASPAN
jgi:dienelactone hydrolase